MPTAAWVAVGLVAFGVTAPLLVGAADRFGIARTAGAVFGLLVVSLVLASVSQSSVVAAVAGAITLVSVAMLFVLRVSAWRRR